MTQDKNIPPETAREEDYRDYDNRNLSEGWPYADEDRLPAPRNAPYGTTRSNLDESDDIGAEIADRPDIESHGGPALSPTAEEDPIDDDVLEERVTDLLTSAAGIDPALITVTVRKGVATLEGEAETAPQRLHAERLALSVKGVRSCVNQLLLSGVDSHIPSDADV